jgi:hypothetical protein
LVPVEEEQEDPSRKPTVAEKSSTIKSLLLRKAALDKARKHQVIINRLFHLDYSNEYVYEAFYQDMKKYPYAWLGMSFDG